MVGNSFVSDYIFFLIPVTTGVCILVFLFYFTYLRHYKNLRVLRFRAFENLENEKLKISRELHDSLGAFLVPLKGFMNRNGQFDSTNVDFWTKHVSDFENYIGNVNENLYPSELLDNNLGEALNGISNNFNFIQCQLIITRFPDIYLKGNSGIHIYRIIQETLVNIIKHANPDFIRVSHQFNEQLLQINVLYQPNLKQSLDQIKKGGRGKTNILQRIEILKGRYDCKKDEEIVFEKFMFDVKKV
jgi:two-component system NarL family sensor kinase